MQFLPLSQFNDSSRAIAIYLLLFWKLTNVLEPWFYSSKRLFPSSQSSSIYVLWWLTAHIDFSNAKFLKYLTFKSHYIHDTLLWNLHLVFSAEARLVYRACITKRNILYLPVSALIVSSPNKYRISQSANRICRC